MFHAIIDNAAQPEALSYYSDWQTIPIQEPLGDGRVITSFNAPFAVPHMSLVDILETLLDNKAKFLPLSSFFLVSHGTDDSLYIPIYPGKKTGHALNTSAVQLLNGWGKLLYFGDMKAFAAELGLTTDELDYLLMLIGQVQQMRIDHIAIRACQIGKNMTLVYELCKLFNCQSMSVPRLLDVYSGLIVPLWYKPEFFLPIVKANAQRANVYIYGEAPNRVILYVVPKPHHRFSISAIAESQQAVDDFIQMVLPSVTHPRAFKSNQAVHFHAFSTLARKAFTYQSDPEFNSNLVHVCWTTHQTAGPAVKAEPVTPHSKHPKLHAIRQRLGRLVGR